MIEYQLKIPNIIKRISENWAWENALYEFHFYKNALLIKKSLKPILIETL